MPFDMFSPTPEELAEEEQERQKAANQLSLVQERLATFRDNPLWDYLSELLEADQREAFEAMFTAPPEKIESVRERVRYIRHLLSIPSELTDAEARLLGELDAD